MRIVGVLLLFGIFWVVTAQAEDKVILKNGSVLVGTLLTTDENTAVIKILDQTLTVPQSDIKKIRRRRQEQIDADPESNTFSGSAAMSEVTPASGISGGLPGKTERKRNMFIGRSREIQQNLKIEIGDVLFFGQSSLEYEHLLSQDTSLAMSVKCGYVTDGWWESSESEHSNLGGEVLLRFYPVERFYAPRGFWVGSAVGYMKETYPTRGEITWHFWNVAVKAGWQLVLGKPTWGFTISPYLGVGYTKGYGDKVMGYRRTVLTPYEGLYPQLGLMVGLAF